MAQELTKDFWCRKDVLPKFEQCLLDSIKIIEAMCGILMEQVHQDLAHVVGEDAIANEVGLVVDVGFRRVLLQTLLCDVLGYLLRWSLA